MHKRKGWLWGAKASVILLSSVETGKANGIEAHSDLSRLFVRLPQLRTVDDLGSVLPWNANASLAAVP